MKVLVADWDEKLLGQTGANIGEDVATFKMDVSKLEDWEKLRSKVDQDLGGNNSSSLLYLTRPLPIQIGDGGKLTRKAQVKSTS